MFELLENKKSRSVWPVAMSLTGEVALVGVLLIIPLVWTDSLPKMYAKSWITAPAPLPPAPPPPIRDTTRVRKFQKVFDPCALSLCAPKKIPEKIAETNERTPEIDSQPPRVIDIGVPGLPPGISGPTTGTLPPPPPPLTVRTPEVKKENIVKVGGKVQEANILKKILPRYPAIARQIRVQGTVLFSAIIGKDGTIQSLKLVSGHPLLADAARDAISQWTYRPTLLNGEPVEVITEIAVNFTLTQ